MSRLEFRSLPAFDADAGAALARWEDEGWTVVSVHYEPDGLGRGGPLSATTGHRVALLRRDQLPEPLG